MQKANRKDKAGISKDKLKISGLFSYFAQDSVTKFTSLVSRALDKREYLVIIRDNFC